MNRLSRIHRSLCATLLVFSANVTVMTLQAHAQGDALEEPSVDTALAQRSLLMDLTRVDNRLVAVGERGHVLISDDGAASWQQVQTPVRVTLTAAYFIDEEHGWVVGHDGVVLRTQDGGQTWAKQLDGYRANELMLRRAQAQVAKAEAAQERALPSEPTASAAELEELILLAEDAEAFKQEGASRPFLDLWFQDADHGIIVGAFGLILKTRDGGESWTPLIDRLENPSSLHLNAIRQIGSRLFIAAEAGALYRSEDGGESWQLLDSPYEGSFFGVTGTAQGDIIAYGLRGNAFISHDWGETWSAIETAVDANLYGSTLLNDGSAILVGAAGNTLHISTDGTLINRTQHPRRLPFSNVVATTADRLLTVGVAGLQTSLIPEGEPK